MALANPARDRRRVRPTPVCTKRATHLTTLTSEQDHDGPCMDAAGAPAAGAAVQAHSSSATFCTALLAPSAGNHDWTAYIEDPFCWVAMSGPHTSPLQAHVVEGDVFVSDPDNGGEIWMTPEAGLKAWNLFGRRSRRRLRCVPMPRN